jgi:hypothetical protein
MEKDSLYEKAEKAINNAFETAKHSVKTVSEKAGEAAYVTKLLIEKAGLEHRVSKKFAELGSLVYEKAARQGEDVSKEDAGIRALIDATRQLDVELRQVEAELEKEKQRLKNGK